MGSEVGYYYMILRMGNEKLDECIYNLKNMDLNS